MILVLLVITIIATTIGMVWGHYDDWDNAFPYFLTTCNGCAFILALIFTIILAYEVSSAKVIDDKIAMYQTENEKIETQIAEVVQQYQEYEQGTFEKVAPDKAVTLVSLYPELKSDDLVSKQIAIYVDNNNKIKELKEDKITASVDRWWLYFGK